MAHSRSISLLALRNTPLSSGIATKEWTEENFAHLSGQIWYGECSTAAATAAKEVTIPGVTALVPRMNFRIYFTNAQTYNGAPTLNVNELGAKNIKRAGTTNAARYEWAAGETLDFVYDDNYFRIVDGGFATTSYYGVTKLQGSVSTSNSVAASPAALTSLVNGMIAGTSYWAKNTSYAVGDRVEYTNKIYECVTANTDSAWTASHWIALDPLQVQIDNLSDAVANIDVPEVEGKFVHLSGDTVSADFTLKIAGNNVLSGLNGNLAIGKSSQATVDYSTALGYSAQATNSNSSALGYGAKATGNSSTALGYCANATGYYSTALGDLAKATGGYSTAIGNNAQASADYSTAIGYNSKVLGDNSSALGNGSQATGSSSTALGYGAKATGNSSTAIGNSAQASSLQSTAVGNSAQVTNINSTALGYGAKALSAYSTALGNNTKTAGQRAIAIGYRTAATATNAIQIGTVDNNDLSNNVADTLQIWDKPLLERTGGKIFIERIPDLPISSITNLQTTLNNKLSGVKMNGSNVTVTNGVADLSTVLTAHQSLSDLYVLSGEVVEGLSNVVIPKLDTISGLVEDEVEKVDEISAKFDNYSLTGHTHTSSDITNFPPIPTVNNGTLTIQKNGQNVQTFTANQGTSVSANIIVPTKTSDLTNDSNFLTAHQSLSALSKYLPLSGGTLTGDLTIEKSNPILTLQDNDSVRMPYVKINGLNHQIIAGNESFTATLTLPRTSGTLALSSQIPTKTSDLTNDSGYVVSSDLTKVMEYQGSVETYANLPNNASKGDVYNVVSANGDYPPGTNYAWNGTSWDPLGGSIDVSKFATKSQLINYLPLSGGSMTGALSANNGFRAGGYGGTTGLSIGNGENNEYYTYLIANVIKTQPNGGGGVVFENGYGYGLSVDAGWASNFYGAYLNATKVKSEELFVNADIYEGGGLSVGQGTDDIYGTYINATNLTAPGMIAGINTTAPHGGLSVTGIDFGDGSYLSSANDFALVSALNKLSSETVNGLSVVVNPKLSTIADKVEEEVAKLDELSGKLSAYTLTSDFNDLISTVTDELSSNINPKLSTIADQVSAETQKVDEISARLDDFALTSDIPSNYLSGVQMNGSLRTVTNKVVDLGTVLTAHQSLTDYAKLSNTILSVQDEYTEWVVTPSYISADNPSSPWPEMVGQTVVLKWMNYGDGSSGWQLYLKEMNQPCGAFLGDLSSTELLWGGSGDWAGNFPVYAKRYKKGAVLGDQISASLALEAHTHALSDIANLPGVVQTGSYNDLLNKPTIPLSTSQLTNDSGYVKKTELQSDLSKYLPLSGGMISSNFALKVKNGSQTYNVLSGIDNYNLAIGCNSSAVGAGANAIGGYTIANGHESLAVGSNAKIQNEYNVDCVAVGFNAVVNTGSSYADGNNAIQLGYGTNTTPHTMQVFTHTLMDTVTGDIPYARLSANGSEFRSILPISATTASTINLSLDTYVYRVTDSGSGAFPTLVSPSGVSQTGSFYYCFEIEWITNSAAASFSQQFDWINEPEIQSDGEWHTYYITGRYESANGEYTMNCWRVK